MLARPLWVHKSDKRCVVLGRFSRRGFRQIHITYQQCEDQSAKYTFYRALIGAMNLTTWPTENYSGLNGSLINATQKLLRKKIPNEKGLQDTIAKETSWKPVQFSSFLI